MSHPFQTRIKPPLPIWMEVVGWIAVIALFGGVLSSTGCRSTEYTAGISATRNDGADCYTARVEVSN